MILLLLSESSSAIKNLRLNFLRFFFRLIGKFGLTIHPPCNRPAANFFPTRLTYYSLRVTWIETSYFVVPYTTSFTLTISLPVS